MVKKWIFGTKDKTPGMNLLEALESHTKEFPIGILDSDLDEVVVLFERFLKPSEVEILCRGFGIRRERQQQNEIAKEMGMKETEVSTVAREVIGKLQKPYRKTLFFQLEPSIDELSALKDKAKQASRDDAALAEYQERVEKLDKQVAEKNAEIDRLRGVISETEKNCMGKLESQAIWLEKANDEIRELHKKNSILIGEKSEAVKYAQQLRDSAEESIMDILGICDDMSTTCRRFERPMNRLWSLLDKGPKKPIHDGDGDVPTDTKRS